jgi:hypothetical protein
MHIVLIISLSLNYYLFGLLMMGAMMATGFTGNPFIFAFVWPYYIIGHIRNALAQTKEYVD